MLNVEVLMQMNNKFINSVQISPLYGHNCDIDEGNNMQISPSKRGIWKRQLQVVYNQSKQRYWIKVIFNVHKSLESRNQDYKRTRVAEIYISQPY